MVLLPLGLAAYYKARGRNLRWPYLALGLWLFLSLLGLTLYHQDIYDHYLGFLSPVPYLLLAGLIYFLPRKYQLVLCLILVIGVGYFNLIKNPLLISPNRQLQKTQEMARKVILESGGKSFNFALIAEHNYDAAYQFYLYKFDHQPKQLPFEVTEQLFVVCEDAVCEPVGHSKHEIAAFGWTKIEKEESINGIKLFKLVPNAPTQ